MSLKILNFLKKYKPALLVVLVFALSFVLAPQALAGFSDWAGEVVGGIIYVFIWTLGLVLILVMKGLLLIATYQNFISSGAVVEGWVVVRDLANMFFVVILLIIAFATILHLEDYNYKKWLPKLILMAILINFSKTICGLLIDVAQIVMLTFVNAFKDVAGGNLVDMLGIKSIVTIAEGSEDVGFWAIVGAYILGLIYMIVALVVITTMMMVLAMRIVMIWIYVVLSPLAYLLSAFPGGAKYASEWWSEFIKNLVVGPVLAFFIWLSFAALQTGSYGDISQMAGPNASSTAEQTEFANSIGTADELDKKPSLITEASTPGVLIKFIIGIGMLIGGLKIAQQIGGAAGSVAGKGMNKLSSMGTATAGFAGRAGKWGLRTAGHNLADVRDSASKKLGVDLNFVAANKRRQQKVEENRAQKRDQIRFNTLNKSTDENASWIHRKAAMFSTGDVAWQNFVDYKLIRGGSKKKDKKYKEKLDTNKDSLKLVNADIDSLETEKGRVVTKKENLANAVKASNIKKQKTALEAENIKLQDQTFKGLENKERLRAPMTEAETTELTTRRKKISANTEQIADLDTEYQSIKEKNIVVGNEQDKTDRITEIDRKISEKNTEKSELISEKSRIQKQVTRNTPSEVASAKANIKATLEGDAMKKISSTTTSDELVPIFQEAVQNNDYGMMSAVAKKMTKEGNYNGLQGALGLGSGKDGMIGLADIMEKEGRMDKQDALGIIAELGEIGKSIKHYQMFGAVTMENGKWQENSYEGQQAMILSEQAKVQTQSFARDANRLGIGHYEGGTHDAAHWVMDDATIKLFASKDASYAKQVEDTGNINLFRFIASNQKNLELLEKNAA
ncbi:hypothetical protein K9M09_02905, partial [Patescibacteria group bacterium]|nr:hypothetical protein [Patescibacteria group bacterium]